MNEVLAAVGGPKTPVSTPVLIGFFVLVIVAMATILYLKRRGR